MKEQETVHAKGEVTEIENFSKKDGVEDIVAFTERVDAAQKKVTNVKKPLPGCGSFVKAEVGDFILLVWSVAALLKCGITLSDYKAFFDTDKGLSLIHI